MENKSRLLFIYFTFKWELKFVSLVGYNLAKFRNVNV